MGRKLAGKGKTSALWEGEEQVHCGKGRGRTSALWEREGRHRAGSPCAALPAEGALLTPETACPYLYDTVFHILSAVRPWQHLISNQQTGEHQTGTLVIPSSPKQHAILHCLQSPAAVTPHFPLVNCPSLYCSNRLPWRLTECLLGLRCYAACPHI